MEKVGILVVSYGSRGVAIVDSFSRSNIYSAEIYVVDKQKNPFNKEMAVEQVIIPDLDIQTILNFAKKRREKIDFVIVGPEKPIIEGIRDLVEKRIDIPVICPTKDYAIEGSKVAQRLLFEKVVPEVNPQFKEFDPKDYGTISEVKKDVFTWLNELNNQVVVKPDRPAAGKGVGVWGDHLHTRKQVFNHFLSNYEFGPVLIEERIEGEESSFQCFCDGKHLVSLPETRDYKRAFERDEGPNTGGMGSYSDSNDWLPFMTPTDKKKEVEIANRVFKALNRGNNVPELRGMPFYIAFVHTGKGLKILENNSRPGDPEIQNLLPILKDDFIDVCFKMIDGTLTRVEFEKMSTVVTYKVPPTYGGFWKVFPQRVDPNDINKPIDLNEAYKLVEMHGDKNRIFPGSMELRENGQVYSLGSRTVCVVGVGEDIETARKISLEGTNAIRGGSLWYRTDIASKHHIDKSVEHMNKLRQLG